MQLTIYNTLTRKKELFVPLMEDPNYKGPKKDFVWLYSCGPTVYSLPHFGNVRASFTADLIRNVLKNIMGYKMISMTNFTDVGHLAGDGDTGEEKMEKAAKTEWVTAWDLAKKYEQIFRDFFKWMQIDDFDIMPRATEHIQEQIDLVKTLEAKWYTYIIPDDGVYMDTSKIDDYGKLLGPNYKKHLEWIQAGERVQLWWKKNITDFALWKFHVGEGKRDMEWESPRGVGFPGRHAECSAMSCKYLGNQFDIHHGGYDLIPIHHTNEIAQSECAFDVHPRVKYWMHHQFVNMNGKKMSKSDGNIVSPYEVLEKGYAYLDIRYFFFTTHYRSFFDFTWDSMEVARHSRDNLIKKMQKLFDTHNQILVDISHITSYEILKEKITDKYVGDALEDMMAALMDDLNTPQLIAILHQSLNSLDKVEEVDMKELFIALYRLEKNLLKVGLFDRIGQEAEKIEIPSDIIQLAEQRIQAKNAKDYQLADQLRDQIQDAGYKMQDTKDGYELIKI